MARQKTVSVTYLGVEASGATKAEAIARAKVLIEGAIERGEHAPRMLHVHGLVAMVWPDLHSWHVQVLDPQNLPKGGLFGTCGIETRDEALRDGVMSAAQAAWHHGIEDDERFCREAVECLPTIDGPDRRSIVDDLLRYFGWQRAYRAARDAGATDQEARDCAGSGRPFRAPTTDRPGDAAAVMHDETGIPYGRCLSMCNMD